MKASRERFLIVSVSESRFAFPLKEIAEVTETFATYPIPLAPQEYVGVMNFHGAPVPVLDLDSLLHGCPPKASGTVLVIDGRICSLAVRVDRIEKIAPGDIIESFPASDWQSGRSAVIEQEKIPSPSLDRLVELLEDTLRRSGRQPRTP